MKINQNTASFFLRLALGAGFLSAVASRLGLWGKYSSGWTHFVTYTAEVNSFAPKSFASPTAIVSTVLESTLGLLLVLGYKTKYAAMGAAVLTLIFACAMAYSSGIKEPLDYSVFSFSAGAWLLATVPESKWSVDKALDNKN